MKWLKKKNLIFDYSFYDDNRNEKIKYYIKGNPEETIENTLYDIENKRIIGTTQHIAHDNLGTIVDFDKQSVEPNNYTEEKDKLKFEYFFQYIRKC